MTFGVGAIATVVVAAYPHAPRSSPDTQAAVAAASDSPAAVTSPDATGITSPPPAATTRRAASPKQPPPHKSPRPAPASKTSSPRHSSRPGKVAGGAPSGGSSGSGGPVNGAPIGYNASADSAADIATAMKQAKADGRNVLLDFGATWCGTCQALDQLWADPSVKKALADHYHLVQIDIGEKDNATNMGILTHYDSSGSYGMPVLIVVTPQGTILTDTCKAGLPDLSNAGFIAWLNRWA